MITFRDQGGAVQPQAQTWPTGKDSVASQGRGNGVPGGVADTQLLASPQQINVSIM